MDYFDEYFNDPQRQEEMKGKPWYYRYKNVLLVVGLWLLCGLVFALID